MRLFSDKKFNRNLLRLAMPIAIQSLMLAAVAAADAFMLGGVEQNAMSAVSLATQIQFIQNMILSSVTAAAGILGAQYWGKRDAAAINHIFCMSIRVCGLTSLLFFAACMFIPRYLMLLFTGEEALIRIGISYLRIAGWSYLLTGISQCYLTVMKVTDHAASSAKISSVTVMINIVLNAVFIFGLLGAPRLGVTGVAIATAISRLVELALCVVVSARSRDIKLNPAYMFVKNKQLFGDFVRLSLPALGNDIVWGVGFSMYSVILGHLGSDVVAANSLVSVVRNLGTIACFALASAGGILLGQVIGENRIEDARRNASQLVRLTLITGVLGGVLILLLTPFVLRYADLSETSMGYLRVMLLLNSVYIIGPALNTTLIAGVFRAGGDSRFGLICDVLDMWVYAVPLGFIAAFALKLPVLWVYVLLCTDEFVKLPFVIRHYRSGRWLKNITREHLFEETA